jgi:hypothetical protein
MRGEIIPHPDWTIDTYAEDIERGKYSAQNKIDGGYARYRANIFDETGRLIGTGTKTEWSERFMDFAEKAETGAIARALAVCGYGTEAALDMDEGLEQDRIADAPVTTNRPITITASNVPGLVQGGRSTNITNAQLNEIAYFSRTLKLRSGLLSIIESATGKTVPSPRAGTHPGVALLEVVQSLSFAEAAAVIRRLSSMYPKPRRGTRPAASRLHR